MDIHQAKFEFEFAKESLIDAILKNREEWNPEISNAIKNVVKNHDLYDFEKKKVLENLSKY